MYACVCNVHTLTYIFKYLMYEYIKSGTLDDKIIVLNSFVYFIKFSVIGMYFAYNQISNLTIKN